MTGIRIPIENSAYLNPRHVLIAMALLLLLVITMLSLSTVRTEMERCNSKLWKVVIYTIVRIISQKSVAVQITSIFSSPVSRNIF